MSQQERNEDPLKFLHRKAVEEGEWTVEVVESFGISARAGPKGGLSGGASPDDWELEVKDRFEEEYSDAIIAIYQINEECETESFDWYWRIGEVTLNELDYDEAYIDYTKFKELLQIDVLSDTESNKVLENARKVYELFPERNPEAYLPESTDLDNNITLFAQLAQRSCLESNGEARDFLASVAETGIDPIDRDIRVWTDLQGTDPSLDEVVERVNVRFKTYTKVSTLAEKVERAYALLGKEDECPDREKIVAAVEAVTDE